MKKELVNRFIFEIECYRSECKRQVGIIERLNEINNSRITERRILYGMAEHHHPKLIIFRIEKNGGLLYKYRYIYETITSRIDDVKSRLETLPPYQLDKYFIVVTENENFHFQRMERTFILDCACIQNFIFQYERMMKHIMSYEKIIRRFVLGYGFNHYNAGINRSIVIKRRKCISKRKRKCENGTFDFIL